MSSPDSPAVRLTQARLDRGGRSVLRDIELSVPRGSITAVLGPSGSGKSTLLAALTGELVPAAGTVEVFGQPVPRTRRALLEMRKGIGVAMVSADERREALKAEFLECKDCTRCPQLAATRQSVVFGAGNADADLMWAVRGA